MSASEPLKEDDPQYAEHALAKFAQSTSFESLPTPVVERAKYIFLDTLGIMLAASQAPAMTALRNCLASAQSGRATLVGTAQRASPPIAAIVNGSLTTVLEFDEGHQESMGHPGIHIIPAILGLGEEFSSSGKDWLTSLVVGYEISVRVGRAVFPLKAQLHPHGNWATIGAATAAAKLLGVAATEFIDVVNCSSMMCLFTGRSATVSGATIHHLFPGMAASNGIVSALAVRAGLSGVPRALPHFLLPMASQREVHDIPTEHLGTRWEILNNYFKPYPACAHAHSAIEALQSIMQRHRFVAADVKSIRVDTYAIAATLSDRAPRDQLAGMFSIPYCLGVLLTSGILDVAPLARQDPLMSEALQVAARVEVSGDPELSTHYPRARPTRLTLHLVDGTVLEESVINPRASADLDEEYDGLRRKFMSLAAKATTTDEAARLLDTVLALDELPSMGALFHPSDSRFFQYDEEDA